MRRRESESLTRFNGRKDMDKWSKLDFSQELPGLDDQRIPEPPAEALMKY